MHVSLRKFSLPKRLMFAVLKPIVVENKEVRDIYKPTSQALRLCVCPTKLRSLLVYNHHAVFSRIVPMPAAHYELTKKLFVGSWMVLGEQEKRAESSECLLWK
jgi:hypothetical protein